MFPKILRGAIMAASMITLVACGDDSTAPEPVQAPTLSITPVTVTVYESDAVTLKAVYRDAVGNVVPDAQISWAVSDTTRAELGANGYVLALKNGVVTVTAKSGTATATYPLTIVRPPVVGVDVLLTAPLLSPGDVAPLGLRVRGPDGRVIFGRSATLASDNPNVAVVDPSGRVRAVAAGTANIRATVDGTIGSAALVVNNNQTKLQLSRYNGQRLPLLIASDTVMYYGVKEYHEVWAESGTLTLSGTQQPKYDLQIRIQEYNVITVNGQQQMELRVPQREIDFGTVRYDARGDLLMTSEYISPLSHTAMPVTGGMEVRYRIPGTYEFLQLFFRREPE